MDRFWKQFAALATASKRNAFQKARLYLTASYALIIAVIIVGFSLFLYQSISSNLMDAGHDDFAGAESQQRFIHHELDSVRNELVFADIAILVFATLVSYLLAGKTIQPIQRALEAQRAFAANASHELRTPLAVMKNDIEVLERNRFPTKENVHATLASNLEEIAHMSEIVEDLLFLARSDNQIVPNLSEVDAGAVLVAAAEKMQTLARSKGVQLGFAADGSLPIAGNKSTLERAFLNVLQNALDHTPAGASVTAQASREGSQILASVADTGEGIAKKDLPHVFERFYKADASRGTGLGLSIVKEIITQHRGTVSIDSIEGKGTTVVMRLHAK